MIDKVFLTEEDCIKKLDYFESRILYCRQWSPLSVANFNIFSNRRSGRTLALIKAIPIDGNAVIVLDDLSFRDHIINKINIHRPNLKVENLKFHKYNYAVNEIEPSVTGLNKALPVYFDNAVYDQIIYNTTLKSNRRFLHER